MPSIIDAENVNQKPTAVVADDHALFAEGLIRILEPYADIVGVAADGRAFLQKVLNKRPDLALLDVSMPQMNGIEAARQLRKSGSSTRVIFVTQRTEREYVRAAFEAGAWGYVLKQSAARELLAAMAAVKRGERYLSPAVAENAGIDVQLLEQNPTILGSKQLSARQREVLRLIAEGKSAKEIGYLLHISGKTVEYHRASIVAALGLRTTAELTRYAIEHGLLGERG